MAVSIAISFLLIGGVHAAQELRFQAEKSSTQSVNGR